MIDNALLVHQHKKILDYETSTPNMYLFINNCWESNKRPSDSILNAPTTTLRRESHVIISLGNKVRGSTFNWHYNFVFIMTSYLCGMSEDKLSTVRHAITPRIVITNKSNNIIMYVNCIWGFPSSHCLGY